ncbi:MBL fold metallo-hydrolase [Luteimicrobium subarcticum]|uniref:Ribonuclease BN (tRNA processing enzyme) n=1 Tax=Luteimicrobium subarcticum TaxID=620910 RepID=A0A2M8WUD1_9MICO|nr:MBL fold metallo-hydrolase [Luteimicrobium subarcticum]PJI94524.1 ribonuclease BN (tRNA processing enzyme) [Luteimicrobium subarcticum]
MRVVVVGSAGSFAGPDGPASCYLVQAEDGSGRTWSVVLDLGNGALGALQRHVDPFALDAVAVSHLHPDHFVDLCGLYVYRRYHPEHGSVRHPGLAPLALWGPRGTARRLADAYGDGAAAPDVDSTFAVRTWEPARPTRIGPFVLEAFPVEHPVEAYAVRVTGPSERGLGMTAVLTYSGDTDACDGLVAAARDADVLLCEAAFVEGRDTVRGVHLTGRRAGEAARDAGAHRLVLTHLPAWNEPATALAEAGGVYDGPVAVARPGDVLAL